MPNNPDKEVEDQAVSIDPQKKYLMDQFGVLMQKVGDGFGVPLQQELVRRLEQTIADFHEEVNEMLTSLKENSEKRHEKLKEIWNNPESASSNMDMDNQNTDESDSNDEEMSEWEKKLETEGSEPKEEPKEEKPKKKGFFGRKKK